MPRRLLSYQLRIWDRFVQAHPEAWLAPVIAVLVGQVPGGWRAARAFEELFDDLKRGRIDTLRTWLSKRSGRLSQPRPASG